MSEPAFIRVNELCRYYPMGSTEVRALDGVSLEIQRGEMLGITGPSGSGKSTLLYLLGGLDRPTSGELWIDGRDLSHLDEDGLAYFRQHMVGFIFQMFNLIPTLTALENVEFPLLFTNIPRASAASKQWSLLSGLVSPNECSTCLPSFPEVSSSEWRSPAPW